MTPETARNVTRRMFIRAGGAAVIASPALSLAAEAAANAEEGVTAPEDLMKEHGVLNRCLLIYEEGLRRLQTRQELPPEVFQDTATLIRQFVEEYHERNEEKYIFPEFERARKLVELVDVLKTQHATGRKLTAEILRLSKPGPFRSAESREGLAAAARAFIRMYRPHEAREDTVLFPALRTIIGAKQVEQLGERMEEDEHKVLGGEGFERSVDKVARIEKQLGIYELAQFTPKV